MRRRAIASVHLIAALALALLGNAWAASADERIVYVPPVYAAIAAEYGVPPGLFFAVAKAESYATFAGAPWPWTLNIRGTSRYFRTRQEAETHLAEVLSAGEQMVDVGPMQINWYWHKEKLVDPTTAFDPHYNLRLGAAYLREQYLKSGDWYTAIGLYHNKSDPARQRAYAERVLKLWEGLGS